MKQLVRIARAMQADGYHERRIRFQLAKTNDEPQHEPDREALNVAVVSR